MKPLTLSILLLLTLPSYGQRDSIVCFTMREAYLILDTLQAGVDHRRSLVMAARIIAEQRAEIEAQKRQMANAEARARVAEGAVEGLVLKADEAQRDALFWRRKAKGRMWS